MKCATRLGVLLALFAQGAAVNCTAAALRFVPENPAFLVADVRRDVPDAELTRLIATWRAVIGADEAGADEASVALGEALLERARKLRQPTYVGRAEAVLADAATRMRASHTTWRLYAQTLQYRHDFSAAESLLDKVLTAAPRDTAARVQRAALRLVRGNFAGAQADCAQLLGSGAEQAIALACLAQTQAASGRLNEAQALLAAYPLPPVSSAAIRAYWLTVRGELHERANALDRAIADYGAALALSPENDAIRASLADALLARGERRDAEELLAVERPGLALLVRRVACASGARREALRAQATALFELESARGDASHRREAALLALDAGDASRALAEALANFEVQKELPDVRILARAAAAAGDAGALDRLGEWLRSTGYRDALTEEILVRAAGS